MTPATQGPAAAPTTAAAAIEMLDLMMRLADLLAHETDLVRAGQVRDIGALQREKLRLSQLYQGAIKRLGAGGVKLIALPAPLRAQMVAAASRLADAAAQNERALRVGRAATRKLLDMLVDSVKSKLGPSIRYTARRTAPVRHAPALAIAFDRRL
ncbi:MAG TPA: hypothetical protein VEI03_06960 [Stellaceae bacterium]|nr:hypothetical protein [Stellaceae bacterium]